eukprot:ctg_551.g296
MGVAGQRASPLPPTGPDGGRVAPDEGAAPGTQPGADGLGEPYRGSEHGHRRRRQSHARVPACDWRRRERQRRTPKCRRRAGAAARCRSRCPKVPAADHFTDGEEGEVSESGA